MARTISTDTIATLWTEYADVATGLRELGWRRNTRKLANGATCFVSPDKTMIASFGKEKLFYVSPVDGAEADRSYVKANSVGRMIQFARTRTAKVEAAAA